MTNLCIEHDPIQDYGNDRRSPEGQSQLIGMEVWIVGEFDYRECNLEGDKQYYIEAILSFVLRVT
jgi:hypothetical protein